MDTDSIRDIDESSPSILSSDSGILSPGIPPAPSSAQTRSGKAKRVKDREHPYKSYKGEGVVYLPGDIRTRGVLCR